MDEKWKEIMEAAKEAYQEGFLDGFEYGSGKVSPYSVAADTVKRAVENPGRSPNHM